MKKLFTDLELLESIYKKYSNEYHELTHDDGAFKITRTLPIDINDISKEINIDPYLIYDRLTNSLNARYQDQHQFLLFTENGLSGYPHTINFPLLCSILTTLREENKSIVWANRRSWISIFIASTSAIISIIAICIK